MLGNVFKYNNNRIWGEGGVGGLGFTSSREGIGGGAPIFCLSEGKDMGRAPGREPVLAAPRKGVPRPRAEPPLVAGGGGRCTACGA